MEIYFCRILKARSLELRLFIFLIVICACSASTSAQVSITTLGVPYTQNFDTLIASGSATWTNNSTIPGWFHARTGTGTTIVASDGATITGNFYSFGTGTATDRSLGSIGSGNAAVGNLFWGVRLQNNTGLPINGLEITYTGEQWRNSIATAPQTVSFSYLIGSPTVTGSLAEFQSAGVAVPQLDFTNPVMGGTVATALDGNLAANRVTVSYAFGGVNIPNGSEVMLRWADPDHTGADHALSIDDFSVIARTATAANISISGRVVTSDGAGISNATVTVTRPGGGSIRAISNPFGYFEFPEVVSGATVVVNVSHRRYSFAPQVVSAVDNVVGLEFMSK